ncbi:related to Multidomain cyclophilin type peptidyl-prolyl cis-trans isomerase [Ustilago trichophora]|uniref:Peptidyl-prolyl cis-trans isomerase n=1 Tax=Ustilago trichophora TaxID=86804 RepID=A0A5C3EA99_9BASI|nr:related to Multidomain cyclophilin type peptidyl-prolyl cis-trans isomerase [Ustilago trichophora]
MSVLLETSLGDIVIDLHTELAPRSCINFLKLCSQHYYKLSAFFSVERDFLAQTGDPTNTGKGGTSIWSQLPSTSRDRLEDTFFHPETQGDQLKHTKKGTVSFACSRKHAKGSGDEEGGNSGALVAGSQFFITLKDEIDYLDGKHAPFGIVVEGQEPGGTLDKINEAFTDGQKRPLKDIRIRHVVVLEDPFPDPDGFVPPSRSPSPTPSQVRALRLADDEDLADDDRDEAEKEESRRNADTNAAALTLEMVGDLPFAEIRPPENILFVCKLNPVTRSDDLELIFSRFGKILSCEVIKDRKTGDSLQYAFIEFDKKDDAERAYFKMQNVLVDDRRIWVDFSQSVSRLHGDWVKKRNGGREAPKGHYKWGVSRGTREDGVNGKGRTDSYRPREDRYQNGGHGGDRDGRDDRRQGDRRSGRDSRDGGSSARYGDRGQRDRDRGDDRERAHKRSRREEEEEARRRRDGTYSSRRDGERSSRHQERDSKHSSGRVRTDDETRERRHDEDRDRQSHRDSTSRRHESSRPDRDDRRGHDRDRDRDHRKEGDRRRDDDRHRHRDGSRR